MDQWADTPVEAVAHCRKAAEARPESMTIAGLLAVLEEGGGD
jgi:hypothetical protein